MNCDKFEKLFIQATQEALLEHIQNCEECRLEYKKMLKTEQILKEAKPLYAAKKRNIVMLKAAASFILIMLFSTVFMQNSINKTYISKISYEESVAEAFPVDEYGLLDIY